MLWFFGMVFGLIGFAGFIDWRRKKNDNEVLRSINSGAKPGESSNYEMGGHGDRYGGN
ncbi:hypothetical protein [Planococcus sp. CAU13]|uniref:hypothetical protein n=1 Tax=Planococcus sp. CAU13 TaxID=1541197 RepID=UPI000A62782E|nr:hypothetical protein [Planococcus sp. CAU13]